MHDSAQVTVTRNSPEDAQQRQVILKLDGQKIATLMFGQSKTVDVTPGKHTLIADNTWKKQKVEFEAQAGEHVRFKAINALSTTGWIMASLLGAGPMKLTIEREGAST
jgi:hypothetical protein